VEYANSVWFKRRHPYSRDSKTSRMLGQQTIQNAAPTQKTFIIIGPLYVVIRHLLFKPH